MGDADKKPAVFLDRDGVLTKEKSYVVSTDDLEIFPYAKECVKRIQENGFYAIVITNQSGVARGMFSEKELRKMNSHLILQTGVDAVYYCPHHPEGIIEKYRRACRCRKPEAGMITEACLKYGIDRKRSYMVGDRASDILAGQRAGIKTILLESGYGTARLEQDVYADYVLQDLKDVVNLLECNDKEENL